MTSCRPDLRPLRPQQRACGPIPNLEQIEQARNVNELAPSQVKAALASEAKLMNDFGPPRDSKS